MGIENAGARPPKRKEVEVLKKILESWNRISLVKQICLGLAVGILLALCRVIGGVHFPRDVIAGAAAGIAAGCCYWLIW